MGVIYFFTRCFSAVVRKVGENEKTGARLSAVVFSNLMNVWCFALLLAPATRVMREMFQRMTALWYVSRVMWGTEFREENARRSRKM